MGAEERQLGHPMVIEPRRGEWFDEAPKGGRGEPRNKLTTRARDFSLMGQSFPDP